MSEELKWNVEQCYNPKKAWVVQDNGDRVSNLISIKSADKMVMLHNYQIDIAAQKLRKQNERLREALKLFDEVMCAEPTGTDRDKSIRNLLKGAHRKAKKALKELE